MSYEIQSPFDRRPAGPICTGWVGTACHVHSLHRGFIVGGDTGSDYQRGYDAGFAAGFDAARKRDGAR